jgi:branched-chain amino acid transport system substrate-binding protein
VTGNWSSDLLLLMKAAGDTGLKVRFATYWLDQPGNIGNAGETAIGHYNVSSFYADANGDATGKFADDFNAKTGAYPAFVQSHTVYGMWALGEALKTMKPGKDGKLSTKDLAFALEKVKFDTPTGEYSMRADDHQSYLPLAVATVAKGTKYKVDGTDMGFKTLKLISGKDASGPVQPECQMKRPAS